MDNYDQNAWYRFTDKNGNEFVSRGDNGYVMQSINEGMPIYVNNKGDWFTEPYLEQTQTGLVGHIPNWFKDTDEYTQWQTYASMIPTMGVTQENVDNMKEILAKLGSQGAVRNALRYDVSRFKVTDRKLQDEYVDRMSQLVTEAQTGTKAQIKGVFGADTMSIEEMAREFKNMSKEDLSKYVTKFTYMLQDPFGDKWTGSEEDQRRILDALTMLKVLNYVDDNYTQFGKDNEFKGLLEASAWQKFQRGFATASATFTESSIFGLPVRLMYGIKNAAEGNGFDVNIEKSVNQKLSTDYTLGANLEGLEGAEAIGMWGGALTNIAASAATMKFLGNFANAKMGNSVLASFLNWANNSGVTGKIAYDFFLNDLPLDIMLFVNDIARYNGDVGKALWNPEDPQPLTGIPFIRKNEETGFYMPSGVGPDVAGGLVMNIVGDVIVDIAPAFIKYLNNSATMRIDAVTNGGATRLRENVALKNLEIQKALTNVPVFGTAWKKFINTFMGPEKAKFIQEARDAAIAKHDMDYYVRAQNLLTLANHSGMTEIKPLYKLLDDQTGVSKKAKEFIKNAKKYGGVGETSTSWKKIENGATKEFSKTVPDTLPRQVKQGLLDYERLGELQGIQKEQGGVLVSTADRKEMAAIEQRLSKTPQKIKDFAKAVSDLNKGVEMIAVKLGISNEDWVAALQLEPRFSNYMTRQSLVPGYASETIKNDPKAAKILNAKRKGYYADNYIDPMLALSMKVEALGRAYAWNEMSKAMVAFEIANGKVIAGKGGVDAANRLQEVKTQMSKAAGIRAEMKYDENLGRIKRDTSAINDAFNQINELLHLPENVSLKSIYEAVTNPRIRDFVAKFEQGKIKFAEGVKEAAGLSDSEASFIIKNTYAYQGNKITKLDDTIKVEDTPGANTKANTKGEKFEGQATTIGRESGEAAATNVSDTLSDGTKVTRLNYSAGVTSEGVPYRYTVENGKITSFEKITDDKGVAEAISNLAGPAYKITESMVAKFGTQNAYAVNRAILFFRDNLPIVPQATTFKCTPGDAGTIGWIAHPWGAVKEYGFHVENGKVVADSFVVNLAEYYYAKGQEDMLMQTYRKMVQSRAAPKNALDASYTPIHEMTHALMARLAVLETNRKIEAGEIEVPRDSYEASFAVSKEFERIHKETTQAAMTKLGIEFNEDNWKAAANTISTYAGSKAYHYETHSESVSDVAFNGGSASKFALAITEEIKKLSERYTTAASPMKSLKGNGIDVPKTMFKKDGSYNFPAGVKTDKQKAKWLNEQRQKNPYLGGKGLLTEENYRKANIWDTFFEKEIHAYDGKAKTAMPELLVKKNGDFLEDMTNTAAKKMVQKIKDASVEGFSEELATMALSKNSEDISAAMEKFIIERINKAAEELAGNMPGGVNPDNLNVARMTLWSEEAVIEDFTNMVSTLSPSLSYGDVRKIVAELFDTQAKGFASVDKLPIDLKELGAEKRALTEQLNKSNDYAIAKGKAADKKLKKEYVGDATQVIHYKQAGEDVYVVVSDPVVADCLKRPNNYKETGVVIESLTQISNIIARAYRLGTTGWNPIALVRNVLRDPIQATIQGGFNPLNMNLSPEYFYRSLRQFGLDDGTIKDVTNKIRAWAGSSGLTAEMRNMGIDSVSKRSYRNKFEKATKKIGGIGDTKFSEVAEAPLEAWESMFRNQIGQQSFIKNFRRTKDVNKALSVALFDTSNSTTNFSHAIGMFSKATGTVPYLSSAINGVRSFWVQFNLDPIGMITRITAGFMVPAMAITAWNLSNEERRKRYMAIPEWYRQSHIILMDLDNEHVFAFPIPEELEHYFGTARKLIEYTQESSPYSLPQILSQGAFGFLPTDMDGFYGEDGTIDWGRGIAQMGSGLLPQAVTTLYEFIAEKDLFTGQDLSTYNGLNKTINTLSNIFGTGIKSFVNSIGMLCGASEKDLVGLSYANTLARDLFAVSFDDAKNQFMNLVGNPSEIDPETGKETAATGLFAKNEKLQKQLQTLNNQIAYADDEEKTKLEQQKQKMVDDFTNEVSTLMNKYMQLYSITGGLEEWKKKKIVKLLTIGGSTSSAQSGTYQSESSSQAYLDERSLAVQRYVDSGLPSGPTFESLGGNGSLELQAAINKYYGVTKRATQDYKNAVENTNLKNIRNAFYDAIQQIYDAADEQGKSPDYDLIEKIQARYLQAIDNVLIPLINEYGINILNNNDFIDQVRRQVNGMIPSDDWRQSTKNAKKFLSTKEFPTATVDVKKWLKQRYSSALKDRGLDSDPEVTQMLDSIKKDIDNGNKGAAQGKIKSLMNGVNKASYYISAKDYQVLTEYNKMVK